MSSLTEDFVDRILSVRYEDLPGEAGVMSKHVMLDGLGVTVAGAREPSGIGGIVKRYVRSLGGAPDATVITGGFKASMPDAAFANGTLCHALDFDNTWYPMNHPTSPTLPAILAVAEKYGAPGTRVIEAIVTAFEVQGRIRLAATGWAMGKGFHKPGVTGTMGATAGVARLLGLDRRQTLMALGLAGSRAGSLSANTGTMTKPSHSGQAARNGVECAILAGMGWTATDDVFGHGGFFEAFIGGENRPDLLIERFGDPYRMVSPGVGFKKHPSSYATHRSIDAALALRREHDFSPERITRVEIVYPAWEHVDRPNPASGLEGKFSVQYTAAAALLDGEVTMASFTDARRFSPDMETLLGKIRLVVDSSIPPDMETMHATVKVTMDDGSVVENTMKALSGWVGQPLTDDQRLTKFHNCVRDVLDTAASRTLVETIDRLETLPDVRGIMSVLSVQVP